MLMEESSTSTLLRYPNTFVAGEPLGFCVLILEAIEPNLLPFWSVKFRWRGWGVAQPGAHFAFIGGYTISAVSFSISYLVKAAGGLRAR